MKKGKLIVFEGADGSGKTTQAELLLNYLRKKKIPSAYISFPRYDSMWGQEVRKYLAGDFGKVGEVDPHLISLIYAGDRLAASSKIKNWIDQGKVVVCNRYVGSSIGHQTANIAGTKEQEEFIVWLTKLEYGQNKIPKEDLVLFLHVPVEVSQKLMRNRKLDMHESNVPHLVKTVEVYTKYAQGQKNWLKIECSMGGKLLSHDEIHGKILAVLKRKKILHFVQNDRSKVLDDK